MGKKAQWIHPDYPHLTREMLDKPFIEILTPLFKSGIPPKVISRIFPNSDVNTITVRAICFLTPKQIVSQKGFGQHSMKDIQNSLNFYGLNLWGEEAETKIENELLRVEELKNKEEKKAMKKIALRSRQEAEALHNEENEGVDILAVMRDIDPTEISDAVETGDGNVSDLDFTGQEEETIDDVKSLLEKSRKANQMLNGHIARLVDTTAQACAEITQLQHEARQKELRLEAISIASTLLSNKITKKYTTKQISEELKELSKDVYKYIVKSK